MNEAKLAAALWPSGSRPVANATEGGALAHIKPKPAVPPVNVVEGLYPPPEPEPSMSHRDFTEWVARWREHVDPIIAARTAEAKAAGAEVVVQWQGAGHADVGATAKELDVYFEPLLVPPAETINLLAGLGQPPRRRDDETLGDFRVRLGRWHQLADEQRQELTAEAERLGVQTVERPTRMSDATWAHVEGLEVDAPRCEADDLDGIEVMDSST